MAECMAREEVYRLLCMSPLMRNISACSATTSGSSLTRTSSTPSPSRPHPPCKCKPRVPTDSHLHDSIDEGNVSLLSLTDPKRLWAVQGGPVWSHEQRNAAMSNAFHDSPAVVRAGMWQWPLSSHWPQSQKHRQRRCLLSAHEGTA